MIIHWNWEYDVFRQTHTFSFEFIVPGSVFTEKHVCNHGPKPWEVNMF